MNRKRISTRAARIMREGIRSADRDYKLTFDMPTNSERFRVFVYSLSARNTEEFRLFYRAYSHRICRQGGGVFPRVVQTLATNVTGQIILISPAPFQGTYAPY